MLVMYLLLAVAAGATSVWLWGLINRNYDNWHGVAWRVAAFFPGITLLILSALNILIWHTGSSGAIPLGAFFSLISLWFLISIPLCFSGRPMSPPVCKDTYTQSACFQCSDSPFPLCKGPIDHSFCSRKP